MLASSGNSVPVLSAESAGSAAVWESMAVSARSRCVTEAESRDSMTERETASPPRCINSAPVILSPRSKLRGALH